MNYKKLLDKASMALTFVGGINWGLVGIANYNLVQSLLGGASSVAYILVGVSAGYLGYKAITKK